MLAFSSAGGRAHHVLTGRQEGEWRCPGRPHGGSCSGSSTGGSLTAAPRGRGHRPRPRRTHLPVLVLGGQTRLRVAPDGGLRRPWSRRNRTACNSRTFWRTVSRSRAHRWTCWSFVPQSQPQPFIVPRAGRPSTCAISGCHLGGAARRGPAAATCSTVAAPVPPPALGWAGGCGGGVPPGSRSAVWPHAADRDHRRRRRRPGSAHRLRNRAAACIGRCCGARLRRRQRLATALLMGARCNACAGAWAGGRTGASRARALPAGLAVRPLPPPPAGACAQCGGLPPDHAAGTDGESGTDSGCCCCCRRWWWRAYVPRRGMAAADGGGCCQRGCGAGWGQQPQRTVGRHSRRSDGLRQRLPTRDMHAGWRAVARVW